MTVTHLLSRWNDGDRDAAHSAVVAVYDELHRIACAYFRDERTDHTLQATAVVNEALMRLLERDAADWHDSAHFIGVAARTMRHILVDHARSRQSLKRGGGAVRVSMARAEETPASSDQRLIDLDGALDHLTRIAPDMASLVELRFFAGLTLPEAAHFLGVSTATVTRRWRRARTWLARSLEETRGR